MAVLFAGCFPAQVKKLVLIEATGPYARAEKDVPELLAKWLEESREEAQNSRYPSVPEAAKAIQMRFPQIPDEAAVYMVRHGTKATEKGWVWKYDPRLRLHSHSSFSEGQIQVFIQRISCPTLLVFGSAGEFRSSSRASRVGLFKNGRAVEIAGSGHHVPHEKPEELARVIYPFLRK